MTVYSPGNPAGIAREDERRSREHLLIGERCIEHGQNFSSNVINRDLDVRDQVGIKLLEILMAEIEKLGRELDTSSYECQRQTLKVD